MYSSGRDIVDAGNDPEQRGLDHDDGTRHSECVNRSSIDDQGLDAAASQPKEAVNKRFRNDDSVEPPPGPTDDQSPIHRLIRYPSTTMAKAKRRKLRARRSKANHGRKPNAGRG
ncbi:MAG: hypothetical protein DWP92_04050 [Armatimonadetes bacterium]|nr:MAG: hypothetical protein DWP92_04050 [Armatimonadota bacterium]